MKMPFKLIQFYLSPPKKGEYDIDYINRAINEITSNPNEGASKEFEKGIEDYLGNSNSKKNICCKFGNLRIASKFTSFEC
jgi:hypothetical protein